MAGTVGGTVGAQADQNDVVLYSVPCILSILHSYWPCLACLVLYPVLQFACFEPDGSETQAAYDNMIIAMGTLYLKATWDFRACTCSQHENACVLFAVCDPPIVLQQEW